jgi:hypothetical protein
LIDVQAQPVHGGSMRYVLSHAGAYPIAAWLGASRDVRSTTPKYRKVSGCAEELTS